MPYTFSNTGRPAAPRLYDEEDEDTFWRRVSGAASPLLSGLGYIGSAIDKYTGGRALRGVLGGKPRELLSLLPFSDAVGITDPGDVVTGSQLNNQWFGTEKDPDMFSLAGAGGIATELLLNPLNAFSFGGSALSPLGKAAAKIGIRPATGAARTAGLARGTDDAARLARAISRGTITDFPELIGRTPDEVMRMIDPTKVLKTTHTSPTGTTTLSVRTGKPTSLGGNISFGVPFGPKATFNLVDIPGIGQPAGRAVDALGRATEPFRRYAGALFDSKQKGALSQGGSALARAISGGEDLAAAAGRKQFDSLYNLLPENMRLAMEGGEFSDDMATKISDAIERYPGQALPAELADLQPFRQGHSDLMASILAKEQGLGRQTGALQDPAIDFLHRQMGALKGIGKNALNPEKEFKRLEMLKGIPTRGKRSLNELFSEPMNIEKTMPDGSYGVVPRTREEWAGHILENYLPKWKELMGDDMWDALKNSKTPLNIDERAALKELDALKVQAGHLADFKLQFGSGKLFPNHPLKDIMDKLVKHNLFALKAEKLHEGLARAAQRIGIGGSLADQGVVPLTKVLDDAGLTMTVTDEAGNVTKTAMQQTLDAMRKVTGNPNLQLGDLSGYGIPQAMADDITRMAKPAVAPAALRPFLDLWDKITNITKNMQTAIWPANKVRNQFTAMFQHFAHDMFDPTVGGRLNPQAWIKPWTDAQKIRAGKAVEGLTDIPSYRGMTAEQARKAFEREIVQWDVPGRKMQASADISTDLGTGLREILPGAKQEGFLEQFGKLKAPLKEQYRFWDVEGMPASRAGRGIDQYLDDTNRIAAYLAKRKQGFSPQAAKEAVIKAHYDFCVDEETEILTTRGWLKHGDIREDDVALTINPNTRQIEWQPIIAVHRFESRGSLVRMHTPRFDSYSTMGHRWLIDGAGKRGGHWTLRKDKKTHFATTYDMVESDKIRYILVGGGEPVAGAQTPVWSDEFVELIGWVITEGTLHKLRKQNTCGVFVFQSNYNQEYISRIEKLQDHYRSQGATATQHSPLKYKTRNGAQRETKRFYFGNGIGELVHKTIPNKQLTPEFLLSLTAKQLRILYDTLQAGDGSKRRGDWSQKDQGRINSFQMLTAMLGIRTKARDKELVRDGKVFNFKTVSIYRTQRVSANYLTKEFVPYEGIVWCPTTENGTWMARRDGGTFWTGNSAMSTFERGVMRRLVPFYSWARSNTESMLRELMTKPGGVVGTSLRAAAKLRGDKPGFVPDWISSGVAAPIGPEQDGTQRYLSGLGLPIEDLGQYANPLQGTLGQLNPLLKAPLELLTGKQFYSGRDLQDLYSRTGMGTPAENLLMNSPAGRFITTGGTLIDPRKDAVTKLINTLTGVRLQDVDVDKARRQAGQEYLERLLRNRPNVRFTRPVAYVPKNRREQATPEEMQLVQLLSDIRRS